MGLWDVDDYGTVADRACWALFAVTAFIVILRVISRTLLVRGGGPLGNLGLDDLIIVLCTVVLLLSCIVVHMGAINGLGRRSATLEPHEAVEAMKWNVIIGSILIWSFSLPKFAIIAILRRILNYGWKTSFMFYSLAITSQACILTTSIWWFVQCTPIEFGWNKSIPGGKCAPISVFVNLGYFTSVYSAFLDLFYSFYPIPFIMRLNMPLKSRIAVSIALGLSSLGCIVSIYKMTVFGEVFAIMTEDPTYPVPYLNLLGIAEGAILIICASLPALGPMLRRAKDKYYTSNASKGPSNQASPSQGGSKGSRGENWYDIKGHRLEDPEYALRSMQSSSVDDVPLVPHSKRGQ